MLGYAGSLAGNFGENGQDFFWEATYSYFLDGQPPGTVHYIEWQTASEVTVEEVRLFALDAAAPGFDFGGAFGAVVEVLCR